MTDDNPGDSASAVLLPWLRGLGPYAGPDTLLHLNPSETNSIELTHAHPSGLAQLLTGRRTRLSTLLRDTDQYARAMKAARTLRAKTYELSTERGIDVGHLAAGTASWPVEAEDGRSETLTAPVLLIAVALIVHPTQDDYELQLTEQARVNPALVRHLRRGQDIAFNADALAALAYGTARFDPYPVLERLRTLTADVPGMNVEHRLLVSTFADLFEVQEDPAVDPQHPVLAALMASSTVGNDSAEPTGMANDDGPDSGTGAIDASVAVVQAGATDPSVAVVQAGAADLDELDPDEELLVRDADPAQQHVLNRIAAGESIVVSAPPGTGQTQTAINAIAVLAQQGKSILIAAERRGTLNQLVQELDVLNLGSLILQLNANTTQAQLRDQLIRAIVRNERATEPSLQDLHNDLVRTRHQLQDHMKSLHNIRDRWGCSPYQAMQSLAELTSLSPAPSTSVRLKRSVLDSIADRTELKARLLRATELGSFSKASAKSPWFGATLHNRTDTEAAHKLTIDLARDIPKLQEQLRRVEDDSEINMGATFAQWGEQLDLLVAIRGSLDKFTPDIFDRSVTDLISATAPSSWRREHSIEMSAMTRSRLRRVAKEYVRPGVHISDLHSSLLLVQQQRSAWTRYASSQRHPSVPSGLAELNNFHHVIQQQLYQLADILAAPAEGADGLETMAVAELIDQLSTLASDEETLVTLPERTLLLDELRGHGLDELLDDLAAREVGTEQVVAELELAWWQSALEAMISGDDYLAMSDGESLRQLEAEYRLADSAHVASGSSRLAWSMAQQWRTGIEAHPEQAAALREMLRSDTASVKSLSEQPQDLVSSLMPVWAASPLVLSTVLPRNQKFDAVILLDADSASLQSAVPAIGRSTQVIAFGDGQLGAAQAFSVGADTSGERTGSELESAFSALSRVLPVAGLTEVYRGVDKALIESLSESFYDGQLRRLPEARSLTSVEQGVSVEYLPNGTGMPSSEHHGVESVAAEVNRAVDLVFDHVRRRPEQSLAVVTASTRHATRVAEAIRLHLANYPWAADFFVPGPESFRVVPVERAAGVVRDCIIFSPGYGRTPHGRALHNFGPLSSPEGRGRFVTAMTRARTRLQVLTCFQPEDLDPLKLENGALDFYEFLKARLQDSEGEENSGPGNGRGSVLDNDPLVADLVDRLECRGVRVWDAFDGELDIAATNEAPSVTTGAAEDRPIAIESDGTERYRRMSVRERSRLRPQMLERLGWRAMPLWTIEVFIDPEGCADLIGSYLGLKNARPGRQKHDDGDGGKVEPGNESDSGGKAEPGNESDSGGKAEPGNESAVSDRGREPGNAEPGNEGAVSDGGPEAGKAEPGNKGAVLDSEPEPGTEPATDRQGSAEAQQEKGKAMNDNGPRSAPDQRSGQEQDVIPTSGAGDTPAAWGDKDEDRDSWLREQRPPHWG